MAELLKFPPDGKQKPVAKPSLELEENAQGIQQRDAKKLAAELADAISGNVLRPRKLDDFVGQPSTIRRLRVALQAAQIEGRPLDHILMAGPPGLGKTTLARIMALEMETDFIEAMGSAVTRPADLADLMFQVQEKPNCVLFIDEIHRMPRRMEELMYSAMEDGVIDIPVKGGGIDRMNVPPFSLIGATTLEGDLSAPLRRRFRMTVLFQYYSTGELATVLMASATKIHLSMGVAEAAYLASRSRGTPAVANNLLKGVRDMATVSRTTRVTVPLVRQAMELEGVDDNGLNWQDWRYLSALHEQFEGGPAGSSSLSASTAIATSTIEDVVEPYLLHLKAIARTAQGRVLTNRGRELIRARDAEAKATAKAASTPKAKAPAAPKPPVAPKPPRTPRKRTPKGSASTEPTAGAVAARLAALRKQEATKAPNDPTRLSGTEMRRLAKAQAAEAPTA